LPCTGDYPITISFGAHTVTIPYTALAVQDQTTTTGDGSVVCLSAAMYPTGGTAAISVSQLGRERQAKETITLQGTNIPLSCQLKLARNGCLEMHS
jgi:hypothetical protein